MYGLKRICRRDVKEHNFLKEEAKTLAMMSPEERLEYGAYVSVLKLFPQPQHRLACAISSSWEIPVASCISITNVY